MIPSILSQQIDQGLKDFLATTFYSTNPFFHGMLDRFLDRDGALNKGPYISLQLPFQKGRSREFFPEIPLGFTPHLHQELAFARISGPDSLPTLISSGTGSGKTECFTQPILEHCRISDQPGIKAIIIYPMNALAYDQAERLAKTIWRTPSLHGKITAGLFIGQQTAESCSSMTEDSIVTDKDILRQSPPDILLTNYKMLDYLLVRSRDAQLWSQNGPETLRFVVVDELHTFDGAQGTDLACLLRRLKARLGTPKGHLCPVGTSATLGDADSRVRLIVYAQQVFGEAFDQDSVITEYPQRAEDFLHGQLIRYMDIPDSHQALSPESYKTAQDYLSQQIRLWTGMEMNPGAEDPAWRVELGKALKGHVLVHNLLRVMDGRVRRVQDIISELAEASSQLKNRGPEYAGLLLSSLLACISEAKRVEEGQTWPLVQVRVQRWYREMRRMVCSVDQRPELSFADDLTEEQRKHHLPVLHCRECGQTGWIGRLPLHGSTLQTDLKSIYVDYFSKKPSQRLTSMFPEEEPPNQSSDFPGHRMGLCPQCMNLGRKSSGECAGCGQSGLIPVLVPEAASQNCPSCGAHNSLTLLGSRSASLTSVMIGQLMASRYNSDPKCITFSDNVQDAAHRAGFFGARTYRFTFRAALQQYVQDQAEGHSLARVAAEMPEYWQSRMDRETFAATFLPPNLNWHPDVEHLEQHDHLPAKSDLGNLINRRLRFETISEYGFNSRIGRTLEKSRASVIRPNPEKLGQAVEQLGQMLPNELEELRTAFTNGQRPEGYGETRSGQTSGQTQSLPLRHQPNLGIDHNPRDHLDVDRSRRGEPCVRPRQHPDVEIIRRGGSCIRPIGLGQRNGIGFQLGIQQTGRDMDRDKGRDKLCPYGPYSGSCGAIPDLRNFAGLNQYPGPDHARRGGPCVRPHQDTGVLPNIESTLFSFLLGLIIQMKAMGGIFDPDLENYLRNWGKVFLLSQKHKPWMPNFGPKTRTPGFVTSKPGTERFPQLTRSGSRSSWFEWWACRHFPDLALQQTTLVQRFYGLVFSCLEDYGLIRDQFQDGHHIYGLEPDSLLVTSQVLQYRCSKCGHAISGAASDQEIMEGMSCLRRGCKGQYAPDSQELDYYGRLYSQGKIARLVAKEHTGLLDRDTREELERKFKAQDELRKPWYPNLLSSTPTLEMGIDIGDLSTTLQCSVPPTQANYIQRIGRSGRKNGNGLNLTVAAGQAHDLYFFASPLEMIAGQVHPPGVFLDASAVLERQYTAFCLDCWIQTTAQADPVPNRLGTVLETLQRDENTVFPHNFIHYVHGHQSELFQSFCALFAKELSQSSIKHLEHFVWGDSQDTPGLTYRIIVRLHELLRERKSLKNQVDRLYREIKRRENSPAKDKNYEQEMEELRQERSGLMALIRNINAKDTYNFLTDEGLLPNYAFPEQGIQLKSIIYRKRSMQQKGQSAFETFSFEYERPAGSGLRELAPGNRFYAEGRRVEVDRIDLRQASVETWRLCANCPHSESEATAKEHAVCPRCGSPLWSDQGRKQDLVRLRQVMANTPDWASRIMDDADEREPTFYTTQLLVDVEPDSIQDAYQIDDPQCPFGFEFISKATFRDINFGAQGQNGHPLQVAGEEVERPGFVLCRHCGKVQKQNGKIEHAYGCPARNKESDANFVRSVFLYREFTSEAIKILLPVTGHEASKRRLDSFVAALQLGLRHHFGGSAYAIDHLQTTVSQEPVPDSSLRKQYLVLFDTVPGGTGFLKQLMRSETMLTVLDKALDTLNTCICQKDPGRDGCYNCLLAYRNSYSMPTTSRQTAMDILSMIVGRRDTLRQVPNLQNIRVDGLSESELEVLFLEGLQSVKRQGWTVDLRKEVIRGKPGNFLRIGDQAYELEPQVELGAAHGAMVPSRADFVIWPARSRQEGKPVAIYTDGLAFHRTRMGEDMRQRMALIYSQGFHVWSLTWKDVHAQVSNKPDRAADLLHPKDSRMGRKQFVQLLSKLDLEGFRELHTRDNFGLLAQYLAAPSPKDMQKYALAQAVSLLDVTGSKDPAIRDTWAQLLAEAAPDSVCQEITSQLDQGLIGNLESGPIQLFVFAPKAALQSADPHGVRIVCCLDDREEAQEQSGFERSWINYLRLLNIFQFLPHPVFVTTQGLRKGMYAELEPVFSDQHKASAHAASAGAGQDQAWEEAFALVDPRAHEMLYTMRHEGWPAPEVGYDVQEDGRVIATAELAWPEKKIACVWPGQKEELEGIENEGWEIRVIGNPA
ncbi:MAG: DEAD/DEAH box helicase [Desulfohalobiaceae bacterium]